MAKRTTNRGIGSRRGVLLLIVLSLLVLFMLVGLSFIVSAGQFKSMARSAARTALTENLGAKLANSALYQILRDTRNPNSPIQGHSLLEDLYGRDYFVGRVVDPKYDPIGTMPAISDVTDNQLQEIGFDFVVGRQGNVPATELRDDYYGGCVITFITGNAAGKSARITRFRNGVERTIRFDGFVDAQADGAVTSAVKATDLFIVNGRPFNGTGAGFSTDDASRFTPVDGIPWKLNNGIPLPVSGEVTYQVPVALAPNYHAYRDLKSLEVISYGGLDESWDAVDYQNLFLAKVPSRTEFNLQIGQQLESTSGTPNFLGRTGGIIPSFHRPFLLAYLQRHYPGLLEHPQFRKLFVFRPDSADHPGFTGTNTSYDPLVGPWDVDNDGDGIPDSIWMDFGLDPVSGSDGRLYKPLIAPLVLDMDGKVNLNTAGSIRQADALKGVEIVNANGNTVGPGTRESDSFQTLAMMGGGWGPADVNPSFLTGNVSVYDQVLRRKYAGQGEDFAVAVPGSIGDLTVDEDTQMNLSYGIPGNDGVPVQYNFPDQNPALVGLQTSLFSGYGSPVDLAGSGVPFISPTGGMYWGGQIGVLDAINDPYEFDPLHHSARDEPYTLADLDYLLRFEDSRAQSTLRDIQDTSNSDTPFEIYNVSGADGRRRLFTTHSIHIPALPSVNPGTWRHGFSFGPLRGEGLQRSVRDMFTAKVLRTLQLESPGTDPTVLAQIAVTISERLMPTELARGEKLDINRALQADLNTKRQFASNLFHLMMLLGNDTLDIPSFEDALTQEQRRELHVRRIAQWAVNVVDFGDADSTMTLFEYDVNPFNSLPVNGDPYVNDADSADARRIWGCEHPELILSETMAVHDRRVQDLGTVGGKRKENGLVSDPDLDQVVEPEGSLFIELLCMRGGSQRNAGASRNPRLASSRGPEDLYISNSPTDEITYMPVLNLAATAGDSPVWRIAISERQTSSDVQSPMDLAIPGGQPDSTSFEPDDFSLLPGQNSQMRLERFIWFTSSSPINEPQHFYGQQFFHRGATSKVQSLSSFPFPVVEPGGYVVIGPNPTTVIGKTKANEDSNQRISLDTLMHQDLDGNPLRATQPSRGVAIVARNSSGNGCNISEPRLGYPQLDAPRDHPLDSPVSPANSEAAPLWFTEENVADDENMQLVTGTRRGFRTVFLQRLANPNLPFNPTPNQPAFNPYVTVDWMPVDLTVFNSLDEAPLQPQDPKNEPFDPQDPDPIPDGLVPPNLLPGIDEDGYLASREKAGLNRGDFNIWSSSTRAGRSRATVAPEGLTQSTRNFQHTLGWLNSTFNYSGVADYYIQRTPTNGARDIPYSEAPNSRIGVDSDGNGTPESRTFPSLVWNNRPYANEYELLLVPASSQARLGHELTTSRDAPATVPLAVGLSKEQRLDIHTGTFGHLLNFFESSFSTPEESIPNSPQQGANYYRILDFVTVPSRFHGTQKWFNKQRWDAATTIGLREDRRLLEFREPGRINLNTAGDIRIWSALGLGASHPGLWTEFESHMRGLDPAAAGATFGTLGDDDSLAAAFALIATPNGNYPAEYPYPYRAGTSADLLPPYLAIDGSPLPAKLGVDATLLRTSALAGSATTGIGQPAFGKFRDLVKFNTEFGSDGFGRPAQSRAANAYFRFRDIIRAGGSVTSQSNVYAIWVTVGFFEIEPNFPVVQRNADGTEQYDYTKPYHVDPAHPDGYRIGAERGSEMGNVERHRSFYIIDRSVPVAFEPGINHNVDNAILLRRHLE